MPDIMDVLVYDREALSILGRDRRLQLIRDDIDGYFKLEAAHGKSPEAGWALYHEVLAILTKVDDAGLAWSEVGYDRDKLIARARRHVLPFLDRFLRNVKELLGANPKVDKTVMRIAFTSRFQRELDFARQLGVPAPRLKTRILAARNLGLDVEVPIRGTAL